MTVTFIHETKGSEAAWREVRPTEGDNLRAGQVVPPERVVRHDGDDPYRQRGA